MTYRQLLDILKQLNEEQLEQDVTVYSTAIDEYFGIISVSIETQTDVVDAGSIVVRC